MALHFVYLRRLAVIVFFASIGTHFGIAEAANVQFVGTVGYSYSGNTAVLTANRVENFNSGGTSGTLHMELWAFPLPYNGTAQSGYKLATYSLGILAGGSYYYNISSGTIAFLSPPNGSWAAAMILTEFDGGSSNGGYSVRDYVNFSLPIVVGSPAPGQLATTSSLAFASQTVGTVSAAQGIVITNIGGTTVTISSVTLTNSLDYIGTHNCSVLIPGASCTGTVVFAPHIAGVLSGNVIVTSNGLGSPQAIPLVGTGVAAVANGQLSMASAVTFANQTVGTISATQTVTISNIGGQGVTVSSLTLTGTDFNASSTGCGFIAVASQCTLSITFGPASTGNKFGTVNIVSNGLGSPQSIQLTGLAVAGATLTTAIAVEYYHAAFNHYFMTAIADEITKLDNGTFVGWARTGQAFKVYPISQSGLAAVCRFFSTAFAPKSSHFYTPDAPECAIVQANPNWQFEAVVFYMAKADISGNCVAGTQPVYRLYNNGQGAAPNHRYTTSTTIRAQMMAQGWIPEGYGPVGVIMCAPL